MSDKSVCVDLDGTLLYYTNWKGMDGRLGKPRPGARQFLINIGQFARVVIFTARLAEANRMPGTYGQIALWLQNNNLPYNEIYMGQGKPMAEAFVDDRAISIPKNPVESDFDKVLVKVKRFIEDV